jgi:UPF0755 protein
MLRPVDGSSTRWPHRSSSRRGSTREPFPTPEAIDVPDQPDDSPDRLPPGVPATRSRRRTSESDAPSGASRPADAYPHVATLDRDEPDDDGWHWDDGRYVRVTPPASASRRVLYTTIGVVAIIGLLVLGLFVWVRGQLDPAGPPGDPVVLDIPSGSTTDSIASLLSEEGVVQNPTVFRYYLRWKGIGEFQAGEYTLAERMSFDEAIDVLDAGPAAQAFDTFTVPEGLTVDETAARLAEQIDGFDEDAIGQALIRMDSEWQPPGNDSWEGLLFPDTYEYALADEPTEILQRMNTQFDAVAREVGLDPLMNLDPATATGRGAYEYIVIASMIERESRVPEEYGKVSRVIHNRLAEGMPLGIDATVLYARELENPGAEGPITDADLALDSPYNTRLHPGLPPTPIAAPGRAALAAALNPESGPWLYYVLASEDGSHFFTDDYDEFIAQRDQSRAEGLF